MKYNVAPLVFLSALTCTLNAFAGTAPPLSQEVAVNVPPAGNDDWRFTMGLPGWCAGISGDFGVKGLPPQHADVPFDKILKHLDMVAGLSLEAQHGPWGFFVDGLYLKLSAGVNTPGPLLNSIDMQLRQTLLEGGVTYRVWEGKRGYFDLMIGARYMRMDGRIDFNLNSAGVQSVSEGVAEKVVTAVTSAVNQRASEALAIARGDIAKGLSTAQTDLANTLATGKTDVATALAAAQVDLANGLAKGKADLADALTTGKSDLANNAIELKQSAINTIKTGAETAIQGKIDGILAKYPHLPDLINRSGPVSDAIKQLIAAKADLVKSEISDAKAALIPQIQAAKEQAAANAAAAQAALNAQAQLALNSIQAAKAVIVADAKAGVKAKVKETKAQVGAKAAAARAAIAAQAQITSARVRAKLSARVQQAEQNLAKQIQTVITKAIPTQVSGSEGWVDPFVGFRARYNFTEHVFATARGDIGGFGVGSKLSWQAFGAMGYQFDKHWASELGYLYLSEDYHNGGFVYDAAMKGAYLGLTYTF